LISCNGNNCTSVFGRSGAVVAVAGDYTAAQITNAPSGNIAATTVQAALNELDAEKQPLDATLTSLAAYNTNGILTQTAADTFVGRTIVAGTGITVTNGNGVSGNPTIECTVTGYTNEDAQDAVGGILTDTASVDFTYNDAGNTISAVVLPAGVDHNSLQNFVANKHIDHTTVSVIAGTGLNGGGDISSSRTLNISSTGVTASSYGSATQVPSFTVNAQGQLTAASNVTIAVASHSIPPPKPPTEIKYLSTSGRVDKYFSSNLNFSSVKLKEDPTGVFTRIKNRL
jgi:hypothetical protein